MAIPKVSVAVITYNQEAYIQKCLQSIIDQEADFAFEIIVGDDCSKDGTRSILEALANKHPDLIRLIFQNDNTGGTQNLIDVYNAARGEYIAHMDGDDWMLPGKLQRQVDAMDNHPDCAVCAHLVKRYDPFKNRYLALKLPKAPPQIRDLEYLLLNLPFFAHSSKMFRSASHKGLFYEKEDLLDCYFHVHHALSGKILFLNEVLGVNRVCLGLSLEAGTASSGAYQSPNPKMIGYCIAAIDYAGRSGVSADVINKAKAKIYFDFAYNYLLSKNFERFQHYIEKSWQTGKVHKVQSLLVRLSFMPRGLHLLARLRLLLRYHCFRLFVRGES